MDTFSLSIVYGIINNNKEEALKLSIIVSLFHFFMPLLGTIVGNEVISLFSVNTDILVGIIFVLLSIQMFFHKEEELSLNSTFSFIVFGFTVSIDSFSVGIGLSQITSSTFLSSIIFSLTSGLFTYIGVRFGNTIGNKIGKRATIIGSIMLFFIGLYYIL